MSTVVVTQNTPQAGLDIGQVFKRGWDLFVKDIGALIVGGIIAVVLSVLTLGILAGPLFAGLYGMVVKRAREGRPAEVGDVFNQMDRFWSFFAAALVLGILIGLASITIVGGVLLATIWLYVFPLMVDRRMGLGDAMKASKDMVLEHGFWQHLALVIIVDRDRLRRQRPGGAAGHAVRDRADRRRLLRRRRRGAPGRRCLTKQRAAATRLAGAAPRRSVAAERAPKRKTGRELCSPPRLAVRGRSREHCSAVRSRTGRARSRRAPPACPGSSGP